MLLKPRRPGSTFSLFLLLVCYLSPSDLLVLVPYLEPLIGELALNNGDAARFAWFKLHLCPPNVILEFTQQAPGTVHALVADMVVMSSMYALIGGRRRLVFISRPPTTHLDALMMSSFDIVKARGEMVQPATMPIVSCCQAVVFPCVVTQNWRSWKQALVHKRSQKPPTVSCVTQTKTHWQDLGRSHAGVSSPSWLFGVGVFQTS